MFNLIASINSAINGIVWGIPMLILIIGTGIYMTIRTHFFQIRHAKHVGAKTIGGVFKKESGVTLSGEKASISQFQALCTALAATIGVGNIAGVAAAIAAGGPGAIFWMWLSAFFGMMTNYSENLLGIYYRRKNSHDEWCGGAMYYLRDGLGSKKGCAGLGKALAIFFSLFCVLASFGIGNMSQVNTISSNITSVFHIQALDRTIQIGPLVINLYSLIVGLCLMVLAGLVIVGGIKRIAQVTEKFVPFMACAYILGALIVFLANISKIGEVFSSIFSFAFGLRAVGGAAVGLAVKNAATWGFKRGVFSNEAGLGSSVMVHSASNVIEPVKQGMWGIFEVFADTIVVCTLTAFSILSTGLIDLQTGQMLSTNEQTALVSEAFGSVFNFGSLNIGGAFIAVAILLFAFSTVLGWSYYGTKAWEFLFGTKATIIYKIVFVVFIVFGATMNLDLAWDISDTFNGMMAIPNLIGVLTLSGTAIKITNNYVARTFHGSKEKPMLSAFDDIQKEQEQKLAKTTAPQ